MRRWSRWMSFLLGSVRIGFEINGADWVAVVQRLRVLANGSFPIVQFDSNLKP